MIYTVRPLTDFTWCTGNMRPSPFRAPWSNTLDLLGRELDRLGATDVVLELDCQPGQLRRDGMLRADARVDGPAVRLGFTSRQHGTLTYSCDEYAGRWHSDPPDWQINVRAIALTLEALRAVDRYGATTGEQYAGFAALGAGTSTATAMPAGDARRAAAELLERVAIGDEGAARERSVQRILDGTVDMHELTRQARRVAHPDRGGSHDLAVAVDDALRTLGAIR